MFKPRNWLDGTFEIEIIGKGLKGAAELIGGTLLLFSTPDQIHHICWRPSRWKSSPKILKTSLQPTCSTPAWA